jgi:hypothetical protein
MQLPHAIKTTKASARVSRRAAMEIGGNKRVETDAALANKVSEGPKAALAGSHFQTFEELTHASGMLASRPPAIPGNSGNINYTVQPFQQLSWYPRYQELPVQVPCLIWTDILEFPAQLLPHAQKKLHCEIGSMDVYRNNCLTFQVVPSVSGGLWSNAAPDWPAAKPAAETICWRTQRGEVGV